MARTKSVDRAISDSQKSGNACLHCDQWGAPTGREVVGVGEYGVDLWAHRGNCADAFKASMGWS